MCIGFDEDFLSTLGHIGEKKSILSTSFKFILAISTQNVGSQATRPNREGDGVSQDREEPGNNIASPSPF